MQLPRKEAYEAALEELRSQKERMDDDSYRVIEEVLSAAIYVYNHPTLLPTMSLETREVDENDELND